MTSARNVLCNPPSCSKLHFDIRCNISLLPHCLSLHAIVLYLHIRVATGRNVTLHSIRFSLCLPYFYRPHLTVFDCLSDLRSSPSYLRLPEFPISLPGCLTSIPNLDASLNLY